MFSQKKQIPWERAEAPTSQCCSGKLGEQRGVQGKQLKESGLVMLNSQVGVVPLDTERFAPVGCLQQVKFQHKRGVQGSLQEGVIAEHRHTHNGGVHHRVLGESARSNREQSSTITITVSGRCRDFSGVLL